MSMKLSVEDKSLLKEAVRKAELNTSGEITTAFIKESDSYAPYELAFALASGFVYFLIATFYLDYIEEFLQSFFWDYSSFHLAGFYGLSIFAVITIAYLLSNIPVIDRLIIPRRVMVTKTRQRALRHFVESGVSYTRDRTGILIFISELERRVELIADKGISEKIEQSQWDDIVANIIAGVRNNKLAGNLAESVETCGKLLSEHFPIKSDDTNELSNDITILEK